MSQNILKDEIYKLSQINLITFFQKKQMKKDN